MLADCPYCLPGSVLGPLNDDHVIPAKLGGTLTVRAHEACNSGAALYIDNPLMADPDVELLRGISGALNTRTGRFKGAQFPGALADRAPALMRAGPDGVVIEQVAAGVPEFVADGEFVFTLPSLPPEELAERTAKILDQLRAEHPGKTVELVSQEPRSARVTIERSWGLMPWVWPRFAAKVALAVLSITMPPEWQGSDGQLFLLALFRNGEVYGSPSGGVTAVPERFGDNDPMRTLHYPWEHTITVDRRDGATWVSIVLFGELRYTLGVATDLAPRGPCVWLCDHRERQPVSFSSIASYSAAITERFAMFGDFAALRHDRPRAHLVGPANRARLRATPLPDTGS